MFGILTSNTSKRLYKDYRRLMNEAFKLSRKDRRLSDQKYAEADRIMKKIYDLKKKTEAEKKMKTSD